MIMQKRWARLREVIKLGQKDYGNMVSVSVPFVLCKLLENGTIVTGKQSTAVWNGSRVNS